MAAGLSQTRGDPPFQREKTVRKSCIFGETKRVMEATTIQLPMTLAERDAAPDELRVPATWEDYVELAEEVPYNIEFLHDEIISMSQATDLHE